MMTPQKIEKWLPVHHFFHVPSKHVLYVKTTVYKKVSTLARFYSPFYMPRPAVEATGIWHLLRLVIT